MERVPCVSAAAYRDAGGFRPLDEGGRIGPRPGGPRRPHRLELPAPCGPERAAGCESARRIRGCLAQCGRAATRGRGPSSFITQNYIVGEIVELFAREFPVWHMVVRGTVVYWFLFAGLSIRVAP